MCLTASKTRIFRAPECRRRLWKRITSRGRLIPRACRVLAGTRYRTLLFLNFSPSLFFYTRAFRRNPGISTTLIFFYYTRSI